MPLRLMCFTAHPDDECGAFGGALMVAHQRGVETSVVCLTEGRAGSHRGNARNDDELASLRRHEFAAALRVLSVDHGEVLNYPDGAVDEIPPAIAIRAIASHIRRIRTYVIVTFGPDGAYGHPDHIAISQFTTAAAVCAENAGKRDPEKIRTRVSPQIKRALAALDSPAPALSKFES